MERALKTTRILALLLAYWAVASMTTTVFMERWGFREDAGSLTLTRMLDGTAERPFAYRVLVPSVVNAIVRAIPAERREALSRRLTERSQVYQRFYRGGAPAWTSDFALAYHLTYWIDFLSLFLALVMLRAIAHGMAGASGAVADLGPLTFCALLPSVFLVGAYFYDFPELLALTGLFYFALRGWHVLLVCMIPVAVLNKETAVLLPLLVAPLLRERLGTRATLATVGAGVLAGGSVLAIVRLHFAGNAGEAMQHHGAENLAFWLSPASYLQFTSIFAPGIPFPEPQNLLMLGTVVMVVVIAWRRALAPAEKRALALGLAVNLPLLFLFGYQAEIRNLSLVFVPLYMAFVRFASLAAGRKMADEGRI